MILSRLDFSAGMAKKNTSCRLRVGWKKRRERSEGVVVFTKGCRRSGPRWRGMVLEGPGRADLNPADRRTDRMVVAGAD